MAVEKILGTAGVQYMGQGQLIIFFFALLSADKSIPAAQCADFADGEK